MLEKLTTWHPLQHIREKLGSKGHVAKELGHLQDSMNRLFDSFFQDRYAEYEDTFWYPVVDVSETDKAFVIHAELAGMTQKDVDISLQDNVLCIQGKKKRRKKSKHENFYLTERSFGRFYQSFTLPAAVDAEHVQATFTDGVLTVILPKTQPIQAKRIAISTS